MHWLKNGGGGHVDDHLPGGKKGCLLLLELLFAH